MEKRILTLVVLTIAILCLGITGCSDEKGTSSSGCTEGETQSCTCSEADMGVQICEDDSTWGVCDCGSTDTDVDTDIDTDTDTDTDVDTDTNTQDCTDGWFDEESNLCWQEPTTPMLFHWTDAFDYCSELTTDSYDDWRLPTIGELRSLIRGCAETVSAGECGVDDSCSSEEECWDDAICAYSCLEADGPAPGGFYWPESFTEAEPIESEGLYFRTWSATTVADDSDYAWDVDFIRGQIESSGNNGSFYTKDQADFFVRCVRGTFTL